VLRGLPSGLSQLPAGRRRSLSADPSSQVKPTGGVRGSGSTPKEAGSASVHGDPPAVVAATDGGASGDGMASESVGPATGVETQGAENKSTEVSNQLRSPSRSIAGEDCDMQAAIETEAGTIVTPRTPIAMRSTPRRRRSSSLDAFGATGATHVALRAAAAATARAQMQRGTSDGGVTTPALRSSVGTLSPAGSIVEVTAPGSAHISPSGKPLRPLPSIPRLQIDSMEMGEDGEGAGARRGSAPSARSITPFASGATNIESDSGSGARRDTSGVPDASEASSAGHGSAHPTQSGRGNKSWRPGSAEGEGGYVSYSESGCATRDRAVSVAHRKLRRCVLATASGVLEILSVRA